MGFAFVGNTLCHALTRKLEDLGLGVGEGLVPGRGMGAGDADGVGEGLAPDTTCWVDGPPSTLTVATYWSWGVAAGVGVAVGAGDAFARTEGVACGEVCRAVFDLVAQEATSATTSAAGSSQRGMDVMGRARTICSSQRLRCKALRMTKICNPDQTEGLHS